MKLSPSASLAASLAVLLALAAHSASTAAPKSEVYGDWVLKSMTVAGAETPALPAPATVTLHLDGKVYSGNASVNQYSGRAKLRDGAFKHWGVSATEMAALDPVAMKQEMAYLDLWAKINRYALDGGELVLSDGTDKNQLRFVRPVKVEPKPLRDTRWVLTGFEESDGPSVSHTTLVEGTEIDLVFAEENRISGTAGVNRFTGTCYALATSPKLAVRKLATTKKAGPPQAMAQETRFLQRLRSAIRYQIDGDRLTLSDESGAHRLLFEAAE